MKIRLYPESILRKKAGNIKNEDIRKLSAAMITAMMNNRGIGLAGPQVGISKNILVISPQASPDMEVPLLLINPKILEVSGESKYEEGCLSVYGVTGEVKRSANIIVETGLSGERGERKIIKAGGLMATVIQHEIDHLNGILFPDRMAFPKRAWNLLKSRIKRKKDGKY
ncbi:MAG: peptide deformylase [Elusimicrobia bacterium]|jgi:peptide deformylase|nr:peptide deformylase [Elusimicrobiota bacterium]